MVAKRGVNPHPEGPDAAVNVQEFAGNRARAAVVVDVVAQQEHVGHGHGLGLQADLLRHPQGAIIAGTGIPDEDEPRRCH